MLEAAEAGPMQRDEAGLELRGIERDPKGREEKREALAFIIISNEHIHEQRTKETETR